MLHPAYCFFKQKIKKNRLFCNNCGKSHEFHGPQGKNQGNKIIFIRFTMHYA